MDEKQRKSWYGDGPQPWDVMKSIVVPEGTTLAEAFAQGSVMKYAARYREKNTEHSIESIIWYANRLREFNEERQKEMDRDAG